MASSSSDGVTPPIPDSGATSKPRLESNASSASSSGSDSDSESKSRPGRLERPKLPGRVPSGSIVVPKSYAQRDARGEAAYPPDDARAMSPRRTSADLQRLGEEARQTLKDHARTLQSSLAALADRIDQVKSDYDRLENENKFLQDYIGGLTKTMSKRDLGSSGKSKK